MKTMVGLHVHDGSELNDVAADALSYSKTPSGSTRAINGPKIDVGAQRLKAMRCRVSTWRRGRFGDSPAVL